MRYLIPAAIVALIVGILIGIFLISRFHKEIAAKIGMAQAKAYWEKFYKMLNKDRDTTNKKSRRSGVRLLIIFIILAIFLLVVILSSDVLTFLSVYWWLSSNFSDSGVSSDRLASIFAIIASIPLFIGIKYVLSIKHKKRLIGYCVVCMWVLAYYGLMYWMERDVFYSVNGEATKCYTVLFDGKIKLVPCAWKVDPHYGTEIKPLTREIVYSILAKGHPISRTVSPGTDAIYFAHDGTSLYCFYERDDGTIELFDMPCGAHPQFGKEAETRPITANIVRRYLEQAAAKLDSGSFSNQELDDASELEKLKLSLESININD